MSVSAVARDNIERWQDFQQSLRTSGFANHPGIVATGIMQANMTVEQLLGMALFVQAMQRKRAERRELERLQEHSRAPLPPPRKDAPPDVLSAGEELSQAMHRSEPPRRQGFPGSGELCFTCHYRPCL